MSSIGWNYLTESHSLEAWMYRCMHGYAPRHIADHLTPASEVSSRLRLSGAAKTQYLTKSAICDKSTKFNLAQTFISTVQIFSDIGPPACRTSLSTQHIISLSSRLFQLPDQALQVMKRTAGTSNRPSKLACLKMFFMFTIAVGWFIESSKYSGPLIFA